MSRPFPTRMALTVYRAKKVAAQRGYDLLKKKSDALMFRFREITRKIKDAKESMGEQMRSTIFSLSEAVWAAGDFKKKVTEAPKMTASIRANIRYDNVAGVRLPVFTTTNTPQESFESLGLAGGGKAIAKSKAKFVVMVELLVRIASLQTSFTALDEAIKLTNRRVNALDNVVLPGLAAAIAYIDSELSELEREEIFRVKKVLEVKRKHLAAEEAELAEAERVREAEEAAAGIVRPHAHAHGGAGGAAPAPKSVLESAEDYDLLF